MSTTREIFGILGKHPERSALQRAWNAYFATKKIDAFLDYYPTTEATIPERLSEMYHFDRRAYIIGPDVSDAIRVYVDVFPQEKQTAAGLRVEERINFLCNRDGVFEGWIVENVADVQRVLQTCKLGAL